MPGDAGRLPSARNGATVLAGRLLSGEDRAAVAGNIFQHPYCGAELSMGAVRMALSVSDPICEP